MIKAGKFYVTTFDVADIHTVNDVVDVGMNSTFTTLDGAIKSAIIDAEEDDDGDAVIVYEISVKPVRSAKQIQPKVTVEVIK